MNRNPHSFLLESPWNDETFEKVLTHLGPTLILLKKYSEALLCILLSIYFVYIYIVWQYKDVIWVVKYMFVMYVFEWFFLRANIGFFLRNTKFYKKSRKRADDFPVRQLNNPLWPKPIARILNVYNHIILLSNFSTIALNFDGIRA